MKGRSWIHWSFESFAKPANVFGSGRVCGKMRVGEHVRSLERLQEAAMSENEGEAGLEMKREDAISQKKKYENRPTKSLKAPTDWVGPFAQNDAGAISNRAPARRFLMGPDD